MPTVSFDSQSFLIDSRRVWLVGAGLSYSAIPHALWADRLAAAKQAGFNCIDVPVVWRRHEPEPGRFDFEGDQDLRRFVELIGEAGMLCVLRPGPFVGPGWDLGGLPAWLLSEAGDRLREPDEKFMKACSRYLTKVMDQVRDLQVTETPPRGGPILAVQVEHDWASGNDEAGQKYLTDLSRYLREHGCRTPLLSNNALYQRVGGTIDVWRDEKQLATRVRQMATIQPEAPMLVEYTAAEPVRGGEELEAIPSQRHLHRLARVLAVGGQFTLNPFHAGTLFGDDAGERVASRGVSILGEAGARGEAYDTIRPLVTFTSQFGALFAHLDPPPHSAVVAVDSEEHPVAVLHQTGSEGEVIFVLRGASDDRESVEVLLPDGLRLPVFTGGQRVAWVLRNTKLSGAATLDITNLRPVALIEDQLLILFGPAKTTGVVVIDGTQLTVKVPSGRDPVVERVGQINVAVLSEEQAAAAYVTDSALFVGADGLDSQGQPLPRKGWAKTLRLDANGQTETTAQKQPRKPAAPKLGAWNECPALPSLEPIKQVASMEQLGATGAYAWYGLTLGSAVSGSFLPSNTGQRLHVFTGGKSQGVIEDKPVSMTLGPETRVLVAHDGRSDRGQTTGQAKGLEAPLLRVKPAKLPKAERVETEAADPFALQGFAHGVRTDWRPVEAVQWKLRLTVKSPALLEIDSLPVGALLSVNDEPVRYLAAGSSTTRVLLSPREAPCRSGSNTVRLTPITEGNGLAKAVRLYTLDQPPSFDKAAWAFAPLELPETDAWDAGNRVPKGHPAWYRAGFTVSQTDKPLWLTLQGLERGLVYLNGRHLSRFAAGARDRLYLPEPWLRTDETNVLMVFSETGSSPTGCILVYDARGPLDA